MNKSDFKDISDKEQKEITSDCYSTEKTYNTNNTHENPTCYYNANTLETQNLVKDDKHPKNTSVKENNEKNVLSNVKKLSRTEKNILDNFFDDKNHDNENNRSSNRENNHNTSHNSNNENNNQDNSNKSHSNCECYNKKYFNTTDISNRENNNNNYNNNKIKYTNYNNICIQKPNLNYLDDNKRKSSKEIENYNCDTEDQNVLLHEKIDVEKLNRYKHIYIKNLYLKLYSNQSLLTLFVKGFLKATAKPWEMLLDLFNPKSNEGACLIIKFIIPLFFIWNFSEVELFILEKVMSRLKVPASFLGLTIMSWGNNAPDMYNVASAMAKGLVDLALNAAIASEIHNILLGLGLPWLVYNLTYAKPIEFQMNDLYAFTIFFFCVFLFVFLLALKFNRNKFDFKLALFLILIYLVFLILIFVLSFNIKLW